MATTIITPLTGSFVSIASVIGSIDMAVFGTADRAVAMQTKNDSQYVYDDPTNNPGQAFNVSAGIKFDLTALPLNITITNLVATIRSSCVVGGGGGASNEANVLYTDAGITVFGTGQVNTPVTSGVLADYTIDLFTGGNAVTALPWTRDDLNTQYFSPMPASFADSFVFDYFELAVTYSLAATWWTGVPPRSTRGPFDFPSFFFGEFPPYPGWVATVEPPSKGWWWADATTTPAFTDATKTYLTVTD